jgi:hypothetical protein
MLKKNRMEKVAAANPESEIWWRKYREIVKRGAEKYLGVFHGSGFRWGYLNGQVDPTEYQTKRGEQDEEY